MNINPEKNGNSPEELFDLEEHYDKELQPLVDELCKKAHDIGLPIFIITCYKSDAKGTWLVSSARARGDFVPKEFYVIRAIVEGRTEVVSL